MKILYYLRLFLLVPLFTSIGAKAQTTISDTANTAYYLDMMQDRGIGIYKTKRAFDIYWTNRVIDKGCGYKPFMRWFTTMQGIVDEFGIIPDPQIAIDEYHNFVNIYGVGNNQYQKGGVGGSGATCNTSGDWRELGPYGLPTNQPSQPNGNGRINGLAFHPTDSNIMWAGSPQGGLWQTINGGKNWTSNTDNLPTLGVSDIAVNPANPLIIYIGTGDRDAADAAGLGVYKSTDGGVTWAASNSGMGNRTISKLIIDPSTPSVLISATNSGLYRSSNSGGTWTVVSSGGNWKDVVFHPTNSSIVYASKDYRFYKSTDNGVNWSQITSGLPNTGVRGGIAVTKGAVDLVYFIVTDQRVFRGLYVSKDAGDNFTTHSTTPNIMDYSEFGTGTGGQAWYDLDIAADPINPGDVYVGGINIFKSADTGKTWAINAHWVGYGGVAAVHADNHVLEFSHLTNAMFVGNDGGVYKAINRGANYSEITNDLRIAQIYRTAQSKTAKDWIISGYQDNGTGMMRGNKDWYTVMGGDGMDCQIDPTTTKWAYSDLYYGDVRRYTDGYHSGTIAKKGSNGVTEDGGWVTSFILQEGTPSTMFIGYKNVWKSTNIQAVNASSVAWSKISAFSSSANIHYLENCISDPNTLYVSKTDGYMYKSTDVNAATPTWTQCARPTATYPQWIESDPKNANNVYIAQSNNIYKSTDGGATWTDISSNLPNSAIHTIKYDSSAGMEALYVGMSVGVYFKDATMSNWVLYNKNLPATSKITDLDIYYDPIFPECSHITASTYGRGTWKSYLYPSAARKPKPNFYAQDTTLVIACKAPTTILYNVSCDFPTRYLWEVTPAVTFINGTDSTSENPEIKFNGPGIYTVKLVADNCNGIDSLVKTSYVSVYDSTKGATCIPSFTSKINSVGIVNVSLNGHSRNSIASNVASYTDYTCTDIIKLVPNTNYDLVATLTNYNASGVKVYIDYNNDGDFLDINETIGTVGTGIGAQTINFTTIANPITGIPLRLRVIARYASTTIDPCGGPYSYGEAEDYAIYFEPTDVVIARVGGKDSICPGTYVTIVDSAALKASNYLWNFGANATPSTATGPGPHQVKFGSLGFQKVSTVVNGKLFTKDSIVFVKNGPNIKESLLYGALPSCTGDSVAIWVTDSNKTNPTYQWYRNGALVVGKTDTLLRFKNITISDTGSYYVIASSSGCSDTSSTRAVMANPLPVAAFGITTDTLQCIGGNSFGFNNTSSLSSGTMTYAWDFDDGTFSTTTSPTHVYGTPSTYEVKLVSTTQNGCKDSFTRDVYVTSGPIASFVVSDTAICEGQGGFSFTNSSSGGGTYSWNYGDATGASTTNGSRTYASPGSYKVKLVATASGCSDSTVRDVHYYAKPVVGFTINKDTQCFSSHLFLFTDTSKVSPSLLSRLWSFGDGNSSTSIGPSHTYSTEGVRTVKLITTSTKNCTDSISKTVFAGPSPVAVFGVNDSMQCLNENYYVFTNSSSISSGFMRYEWGFGNDSTSTMANGTHSYSAAGTYTVKLKVYSLAGDCPDSFSRIITVAPSPISSFVLNKDTQCFNGHSFNVTNSSSILAGGYSDTFFFGDGSFANVRNPMHTYTKDGAYTILHNMISDKGCTDSSKVQVELNASPIAAFAIADTGQCFRGHGFNLTNNSSINTGTYSNLWNLGDGKTSTTAAFKKSYLAVGNYDIKLVTRSNKGCLDSTSKKVLVHPETNIGYTINKDTQCFTGHLFTYSDTSTLSSGSYTRLWKLGDSDTSSAQTLGKIYGVQNNYNVKLLTVTDHNCKDSIEKKVSLLHSTVADFGINKAAQCMTGNSFVFNNTSTNTGGILSSSWDFGDGSGSILKNPSHVYSQDSTRTVTLISSVIGGCKDTITRDLEVLPMPIVHFTIEDSLQCLNGNTMKFTDNSSVRYGSIKTHTWNFGDNTGINSTNANHLYAAHGNFTVTKSIETAAGCIDSFKSVLQIYESPVVDYTINKDSQCFVGNDFVFTNNSSIGMGTLQYDWDFGDNSTTVQTKDAQRNFLLEQAFNVKLNLESSNGCKDSISKTIMVMPNPVASFTITDTSQCLLNNSYEINNTTVVSSGVYTSVWDFGDGSNSNFNNPANHFYSMDNIYNVSMEVKTAFGCKDNTARKLIVHPMPIASFNLSDLEKCLRGNLFTTTDNSKLSKGNIDAREWDFGDGVTATNTLIENHTYTTAGLYDINLKVTTREGCIDDTTISVTVNAHPTSGFTTSNECLGDSVSFVYTGSADGNTYFWSFGDGGISTIQNPKRKYNKADTFDVRLITSNLKGCKDTLLTANAVTVYPKPVAAFTSAKTSSSGTATTMSYVDGSTNASLWTWSFGDGNTSFLQNPENTYGDTGTFTTHLMVQNEFGCTDSASETKFIYPDFVYHIPNSFTPNEDGLNDIWRGEGLAYTHRFSLKIYNRWGELIFTTKDPQATWDGTFLGKPLMNGVYIYIVSIEDLSHNTHNLSGEITLLR